MVGESSEVTDRVREGPFDIYQNGLRSLPSPRLLQDNQGCLFRITSYDVESDGPNFAAEHGVQLHDQGLLEYVGAPESAQLMSRSPEYWVHHVGRETTSMQPLTGIGAGLVRPFTFTFTTVLPDSYDSLTMYYDKYLLYIVWGQWEDNSRYIGPQFASAYFINVFISFVIMTCTYM